MMIIAILAVIAVVFSILTLPALIKLLEAAGVNAKKWIPFYRLFKLFDLTWKKGSFWVLMVALALLLVSVGVLNNADFQMLSKVTALGDFKTISCVASFREVPEVAAIDREADPEAYNAEMQKLLQIINETSAFKLKKTEPFAALSTVDGISNVKKNIKTVTTLVNDAAFWDMCHDGTFDTADYFDSAVGTVPTLRAVLTLMMYVAIIAAAYTALLLPFYVAGKYGKKAAYGAGLLCLPFIYYNKLVKENVKYQEDRHVEISLYPYINGFFFILFCLFIIVPIWKVLVDSFDLSAGYGMSLLPKNFGLAGYTSVLSNPTLVRPFMISVVTTLSGTVLGLLLSTLGAYVLIQWDMPGRNFFAFLLLFTMIFQGGMIPTYIVMNNMLHITNTLWVVILMPAINVYNLVLMRNFFEGIPTSLFESATLDGCTPMQIFYKIVLPLSKAALASIGLMFAVTYWNDYTNYKLYIPREQNLFNFQMKLRSVIMGSDLPSANGGATENTVTNAAVIVAILPFMILYPFLQKYFVKGINIGAVKE